MGADSVNAVTRWVFLAPWGAWLIWEIALLILRGRGLPADTLSMQAQRLGYAGLTTVVYLWSGLGAHYWLNWVGRPVWSTPVPGIIFWLLAIAALVFDLVWLRVDHSALPRWVQLLRWPPTVLVLGAVSGYLLFPQRANWSP